MAKFSIEFGDGICYSVHPFRYEKRRLLDPGLQTCGLQTAQRFVGKPTALPYALMGTLPLYPNRSICAQDPYQSIPGKQSRAFPLLFRRPVPKGARRIMSHLRRVLSHRRGDIHAVLSPPPLTNRQADNDLRAPCWGENRRISHHEKKKKNLWGQNQLRKTWRGEFCASEPPGLGTKYPRHHVRSR